MSKSHNDYSLFGQTYRVKTVKHNTVYESKIKIINAETHKPFTYLELYTALQNCIQVDPLCEQKLQPYLPGIKKKAAERPNAEFCRSHRGKSKESAKRELENIYLSEIKTLMRVLFSKSYEEKIAAGSITLSAFLSYVEPYLAPKEDNRSEYVRALRKYVLPAIGRTQLKKMITKEEQENLCKKIVKHMSASNIKGKSTYSLVSKAYIALLQKAAGYNVKLKYDPSYIVPKFFVKSARADINQKAFRSKHLDEDQRRQLFGVLAMQEYRNFALLLVLLLYCGLDAYEIPALHYGDLQSHSYNGTHFLSVFVDRRMHRASKKFAVQRAYNENFQLRKLRSLALSPWTCHVLEQQKAYFRSLGRTDAEINNMSLSTVKPNKVLNPQDLKKLLHVLIDQAELPTLQLPSVDEDHNVTVREIEATESIILYDARYLAEHELHYPTPMQHAMFGFTITETDEKSYLDLDAESWLYIQYCFLRRLDARLLTCAIGDPSIRQKLEAHAQQYIIHATQDTVIHLQGNYSFNAKWRIVK